MPGFEPVNVHDHSHLIALLENDEFESAHTFEGV